MDANGTEAAPETAAVAVDVAVVGGGPTGAMAALGAAEVGWSVALIAPVTDHDPRTTALLMPSVRFLAELGVWRRVARHAAPLVTMRLIDATGRLPRAPELAFDAGEVGLDQFGFNIMNDDLNAGLAERLAESGVVRVDARAEGFQDGSPATVVADGRTVTARLVVAADGAESTIRRQAGIGVREWFYEQSAFVTTLSHERPHGDTSTEFHTSAGPFTLVPLPGDRSSLVWVARPQEAERWMRLDPGPLAREVERRAASLLGHMSVDGARGVIALRGLLANRLGHGSVVLVGEAAHRFPPIGAQGLNLGVRDAAVLRDVLDSARLGGTLSGVAERYDRSRRADVALRAAGVDLLNRSLLSDLVPVSVLRATGLAAAHGFGPLRRAMIRFGLGARAG